MIRSGWRGLWWWCSQPRGSGRRQRTCAWGGRESAKTIFMKSALEDFVLADFSDPADHKFQTHVSAMIEARGKRV